MTEEKELIKKRGSIKGRLTVFASHLKTLNVSKITVLDVRELQLRLGKIELLYDLYDEVQSRIECITENMEPQIDERTEFESQYYKLCANAQVILDTSQKESGIIEKTSSVSRSRGNHGLVKLPTIQLPKFGGSYEHWLEFHDTFSSLIHGNEDIDEINKFHYLRASLEGSAAVVIQSIEFSANNYSVAWKLLCERFDNKRLLIQNHVAALFNLEPVTKESSVTLKRVIDHITKNVRALESLGEPVTYWDTLLIYIITHKLDAKTYREWEECKGQIGKNESKPIKLDSFLEFLRNRADLIETIEVSKNNVTTSAKQGSKIRAMVSMQGSNNNVSTNTFSAPSIKPCPNCSEEHYLNNCPKFLALSCDARYKLIPTYKVCFNCFRSGHYANSCKKPGCKVCKRKHHTLIHVNELTLKSATAPTSADCDNDNFSESSHRVQVPPSIVKSGSQNPSVSLTGNVITPCENTGQGQCDVLLSTALVKLYDSDNRQVIARAILDSGSTSCLMTEGLHKRLNLPADRTDRSVIGINNITSHISQICRVPIKSLNENFATYLSCFILPSITDNVPGCQIDVRNLDIPSDICLADPHYYSPAAIDLIIGADVFWDILGSQSIKLGNGKPILYETRLGWIVSGPVYSGRVSTLPHNITCNFTQVDSMTSHNFNEDIQNQLMRFWQLEEVGPQSHQYFPEEKLCEEHFVTNTTRLVDGRFCVRIPLKQPPDVLGSSYQRAKHCLLSLERRLKGNDAFGKMYKEFMFEYENLSHMSECKPVIEVPHYYIPHHGVLRDCSTTTKLRVVFNASSPTSSGVSFNDIQMIGPTVQDDLLSILLRFRQHKYVLVADVEKMYRQIVVHEADRPLQQIIWRDNESNSIRSYALNRVSYGTASAPYLATRCLKQIGLDCKDPKIAEVIVHDFYVDDLLTGSDVLSEALRIREQVTAELASACMPLRKWKSNEPQLLSQPSNQSSSDMNLRNAEPNKTLGLGWHSDSDQVHFPIGPLIIKGNTKRDILSVIAQIFDPLGLLSPCVILMKIILQKLWLQRLSWDEELPPEISQVWIEMVKSLPDLSSLRIPRRVICDSYSQLELHVFTDASERAYGACIYVRSIDYNDKVSVHLLLAKSRVAPIKPTTIPRLELCGALIGARIYEKCVTALRAQINRVILWTDSTIVLGWLKMLPSRLQPFVRNRIAEILDKTGSCTWRHVPTDENPADLISRGISVSALQSHKLWWQGPDYLTRKEAHWPASPSTVESLPETRNEVSLHTSSNPPLEIIDFTRFSNFVRLLRSVAYVLRFLNILKKRTSLNTKYLSAEELQNAKLLIMRQAQMQSFPEYALLVKKQNLPRKSPLIKLNVYLDSNDLIRVGGRLDNSSFPFEKKHPIVLQSTHHVTKILFEFEHKRLMHAGPQLLLATIRETYWPIGGRNLSKKCYRQCVRCNRIKGKVLTPLMGNLPQQRLKPGGYAFENAVGVDYAGPVSCATRSGRGCRLTKSYIAVFVCFTTKAVHLELVGDLTSHNYLLALRRFISRRGKPKNMFSDNGTSFVGAYNDLSKFLKTNCDSLAADSAQDSIHFHFIPAYSPNFGGLWEAGVKSTKHHLNRVLGNCNLTFEELTTTLVQIEAVLNSRPLTPLSSDPEDLTPLTPGHFLIGRPLTSLPEKNYQDSVTRLTRYQRIEQLRQHFWTRWSKEYVAELQERVKWRTSKYSLQTGTLVVLKEDNLQPMRWRLGRIVAVYPGVDNISRVADIKTANGVVRRSFSKIVPLLPEDDVSS